MVGLRHNGATRQSLICGTVASSSRRSRWGTPVRMIEAGEHHRKAGDASGRAGLWGDVVSRPWLGATISRSRDATRVWPLTAAANQRAEHGIQVWGHHGEKNAMILCLLPERQSRKSRSMVIWRSLSDAEDPAYHPDDLAALSAWGRQADSRRRTAGHPGRAVARAGLFLHKYSAAGIRTR